MESKPAGRCNSGAERSLPFRHEKSLREKCEADNKTYEGGGNCREMPSKKRKKRQKSSGKKSDLEENGDSKGKRSESYSAEQQDDKKRRHRKKSRVKYGTDEDESSKSNESYSRRHKKKRKKARKKSKKNKIFSSYAPDERSSPAHSTTAQGLKENPTAQKAPESAIASSDTNIDEKLKQLEQYQRSVRASKMKPMTKEQYEIQRSIVREVYDPESNRTRLVRGDGEIIERIVTRQEHLHINRIATAGDGRSFARGLSSVICPR